MQCFLFDHSTVHTVSFAFFIQQFGQCTSYQYYLIIYRKKYVLNMDKLTMAKQCHIQNFRILVRKQYEYTTKSYIII